MTTSVIERATPLWARLAALVVVPLVAVAVLGVQRINAEEASARQAAELVQLVELQAAVTAVLPPAQLEQTALGGLARIDELGVPRELVVGLTGVDFEEVYVSNQLELDHALMQLADDHADQMLPDGSHLGTRLSLIIKELRHYRELSDRGETRLDDVDAVFDELDAIVLPLLTAAQADPAGDSPLLADQRVQVQSLSDAIISAGELNVAVMGSLIKNEGDAAGLIRAEAAHDAHLDTFAGAVTQSDRSDIAEVRAMLSREGTQLTLQLAAEAPGDLAANPQLIREAAATVLQHVDYVTALADYSTTFLQATADDMRTSAAEARDAANRTKLLLAAIALFTLILIVVVAWSILAPIRRLVRRADSVRSGELHLDTLPLSGPSDVRTLTRTMNDMAAVLGRVNDSIERLAVGDIEAGDEPELPGTIGVSLHNSVHRLSSVTKQLHRSEALSSAIIEQAGDSIWTVDSDGHVITANDASTALTGIPVAAQIGMSVNDLLSQTSGEATIVSRPHESVKVLLAKSVVDTDDGRVTTLIAHDISERSEFEDRLAYQAKHDALTGLPNRFALLEHLEQLSGAHSGEIAVLYLDLDGFKSINDVQGHAVGDRVLKEIGAKLAASVRDGEFVGRLGGDEFVIVTHRFNQVVDVMSLGHRLVREIEMPHENDGQFFSLSASVGVALPAPDTASLDMIGQADSAVYQAKRQGRGRVVLFDSDMQQRLDSETETKIALRSAVTNNELVMHIQPVFDLRHDCIIGGEALVRWERPGHGLVPPAEFIPIAERSDLILEIERWVLTQACERLVAWREREPGCQRKIAVNISGRHLTEGDLVSDVRAIVGLTGADASMLELELTETHLLEDMRLATTTLELIREMGITIAVDDFGTGFSSMTYLRDLPVDVVKIDRSFVARATEHGYDSTVIEAILNIARTLALDVVAEGIETDDQLDYLRTRGCTSAQGFLMARPLPVADAEAIIFAKPDCSRVRAAEKLNA